MTRIDIIDRMLKSSEMDWYDGGFFSECNEQLNLLTINERECLFTIGAERSALWNAHLVELLEHDCSVESKEYILTLLRTQSDEHLILTCVMTLIQCINNLSVNDKSIVLERIKSLLYHSKTINKDLLKEYIVLFNY